MPTWLGIDIGSASVKVAAVRSTYRKVALTHLASVDVSASGDIAEALRGAARMARDAEGPGPDAVAAAIDGSRAAIHRLTLPATAQKQLSDVLTYELESQVPFDLAEAVFDWRLLERSGVEGQLAIVAAVARIDDVRARIDLVNDAIAQEPERIGVGALALVSLVPFVPALAEAGSVAVVDLGAKASEVLVLEGGEPVFARTLSSGTDGLPANAQRLARDIRVSFAAHRSQGGTAPARVYLCGGGAFVSGAEGFLSGALEIPVHVLPDPSLDVSAIGPEAVRELPRYAKAVALALSLAGRGDGMNVRRGPLAFERGFAWVRERIPLLAGLAAVILVSFVFSAWARLYAAHKERDALTSALGQVTKEVLGTEATGAQEAQELLAKETALTDEDPMPHADGFDVMVALSDAIPVSMTHDIEELDLQKSHVVVRGVVGSIPDAQSIASTLSDDGCLKDVKIKSTTQAVGSDRQKYAMEFDLKCPEDVKATPKKKGDASSGTGASGSSSAGGK
jgi:general secretion pathway protein L